jgi:hypothetical protein
MKICLCGSTRFMDQFQAANVQLTLAGHVVYSVAAVSTGNHSEITNDQKIMLDAVHLSKIEECDAIVVVGRQEDGSLYIGDSTRREIAFARVRDKDVVYYSGSDGEFEGPNSRFLQDIQAATITAAQREEQRIEAEKQHRDFLAQFDRGSKVDNDDNGDMDHSGDPEVESEETH